MKKNDYLKIYVKFFIIFFFLFLLIFNYQDILIFSNYEVIWHYIVREKEEEEEKISNFIKTPSLLETSKENKNSPQNGIENKSEENQKLKNFLKIKKIELSAPIAATSKKSEEEVNKALDRGVLLHWQGASPGKTGQVYLLGHSAPAGWPDINYDNVFNNINLLEKNDIITVEYGGETFYYQIFGKKVFFPKEENSVFSSVGFQEKILILITCWPKGKDYQRLAVMAKIIE